MLYTRIVEKSNIQCPNCNCFLEVREFAYDGIHRCGEYLGVCDKCGKNFRLLVTFDLEYGINNLKYVISKDNR